MMNHEHYTYRVIWSEEDGEFVGLCTEFLSLSWLDETLHGALNGIADLVKSVTADMTTTDEIVPVPISHRQYSGKFQVGIPPDQHHLWAMQAAEESVSLNRYVSAKLVE